MLIWSYIPVVIYQFTVLVETPLPSVVSFEVAIDSDNCSGKQRSSEIQSHSVSTTMMSASGGTHNSATKFSADAIKSILAECR